MVLPIIVNRSPRSPRQNCQLTLNLPMDSKSPSTILTTNFQATFSALSSVSQNSAPWSFILHLLEPSLQWPSYLSHWRWQLFPLLPAFQERARWTGRVQLLFNQMDPTVQGDHLTLSLFPFSPLHTGGVPLTFQRQSLGPALTGGWRWPTLGTHPAASWPQVSASSVSQSMAFNKWGDSSTSLVFNTVWKCCFTVLSAAFLTSGTTINSFQTRCWEKVGETRSNSQVTRTINRYGLPLKQLQASDASKLKCTYLWQPFPA